MTDFNTYDRNDEPKLQATFTQAGVNANPTAVALKIKRPDGRRFSRASGFSGQGDWNAATNTPELADGAGAAGQYYVVDTPGTVDLGSGSIAFAAGDWVYYNGDVWQCLPAPETAVLSSDEIGVFYTQVQLTQPGSWFYRFEGVGAGQAAGERRIEVSRPQAI
jgi:hypothetical protein